MSQPENTITETEITENDKFSRIRLTHKTTIIMLLMRVALLVVVSSAYSFIMINSRIHSFVYAVYVMCGLVLFSISLFIYAFHVYIQTLKYNVGTTEVK